MAKKKEATKGPVRVKCRDCIHSSAFGDNSCYCAAKRHRECACNKYGQLCRLFVSKAF